MKILIKMNQKMYSSKEIATEKKETSFNHQTIMSKNNKNSMISTVIT